MSRPILHQLIIGATPHDAITQNAYMWQRWLQEAGFASEIYATSIEEGCQHIVRPWHSYRSHEQAHRLLYHHSLGSPIVDELLNWPAANLIPVYHNVTPARWFKASHPELARLTNLGIEQLHRLGSVVPAAIGVSEFNCADMRVAGFKKTAVVPITFDDKQFDQAAVTPLKLKKDGPVLLFVGRLSPNKCQEDLVRLLYACQQLEPATQLILIGSHWMPDYVDWVRYVAEQLGVADSVHLLGSVSFGEMAAAYKAADLYISFSEHEGFGMPLIESMYFELPILAYRSTAVTDTLGGASLTVGRKDYAALAQLVLQLCQDHAWQQRIIARQNKRLHDFLEPQVKTLFFEVLNEFGIS